MHLRVCCFLSLTSRLPTLIAPDSLEYTRSLCACQEKNAHSSKLFSLFNKTLANKVVEKGNNCARMLCMSKDLITEWLADPESASNDAVQAVREFVESQLARLAKAGINGGRPRKSEKPKLRDDNLSSGEKPKLSVAAKINAVLAPTLQREYQRQAASDVRLAGEYKIDYALDDVC